MSETKDQKVCELLKTLCQFLDPDNFRQTHIDCAKRLSVLTDGLVNKTAFLVYEGSAFDGHRPNLHEHDIGIVTLVGVVAIARRFQVSDDDDDALLDFVGNFLRPFQVSENARACIFDMAVSISKTPSKERTLRYATTNTRSTAGYVYRLARNTGDMAVFNGVLFLPRNSY